MMADVVARIAVVEPYLGGSHRAWAEGYAVHSSCDVEVFGLPAVHWKWRMQAGHLSLTAPIERAVDERGPFDAVVASSMTNVPALLGLARRSIGGAPVVLYMHENQLTFPLSDHDRPDLTYPMINWASMVAADRVVWNSAYHRDEWFDALPGFLARFPDHRGHSSVEAVRERSTVLPVGVDLRAFDRIERNAGDRPLVLWNQRWEYDKGPDEFAVAVEALAAEGLEFDVALAGERFADEPASFGRLRATLGERLVHDGHADEPAYRALLKRSDVVVSTARHEFFGVAIVEAMYAGAFPVLPNRLVYPERIPPSMHAECLYDDAGGLIDRLRRAITQRGRSAELAHGLTSAVASFDWGTVAPAYDRAITSVAR